MPILAESKLKILNKVFKEGKTISEVCREAKIARKTFYQWKKRYFEAPNRIKKLALKSNYVFGKNHPRNKRHKFEDQLLSIVVHHPSWGSRKISAILGKGGYKLSNHAVYSLLKDLNLETKEKREDFSSLYQTFAKIEKIYRPKPLRLTPESRKRAIEEVVIQREPVIGVCQKFHLSRKTFYKWLTRYQEAKEKEEILLRAMEDDYVEGFAHPRAIPENIQKEILNIVVQHPEYSTHKVAQILVKVGNHGVQNVFQRLNLNTYEKRVAYVQTYQPITVPVPGILERLKPLIGRIPVISAIPPPVRENIASIFRAFTASFLSSILLSTIIIYWLEIISQTPVFGAKLGLFFATISLFVGSIFFIYSMKYYFTLAIVLSFSRQPEEEGGGFAIGLNGRVNGPSASFGSAQDKGSGWLQRIFGLVNGNGNGEKREMVQAGGLQPSLEHIKLTRYPFISIHLPFYNEKKVAERILKACTSIDYFARGGQAQYEIIVCDDSTDETIEIVNKFAKEWNSQKICPYIKVLHRPTREGFKGGALREALRVSSPKTEFVVVFDADFIPYPDTLELFMKYFQVNAGSLDFVQAKTDDGRQKTEVEDRKGKTEGNPSSVISPQYQSSVFGYQSSNIAVVAGYQWHVLNKSENWITRGVRTEYAGSYVIERPGQEILGAMKLIHGSVYAIRADILRKFGWGTSITEDFELTLKLYEQGYKVIYTPYIQAPAECVSTLKRLIRQRMRWAEGHSRCVKRMFLKLLSTPNMSLIEKLEFLYISPYYLQAFFFLLGTFSWLLAETVFRARLPFWTSLWGWSLVLTNFFALPLVNAVGLFLEEAEEKDYLGILSFVALSYLLVPFQAYASVKGFIETKEGPWFRTPKTGLITDIFTRGRFYRWISGILPGKSAPAIIKSIPYSYLALTTANNQFNKFKIPKRRIRWLGKAILVILLIFSLNIVYFVSFIPIKPTPVQAVSGTIVKGKLEKEVEKPEIFSTSVSPESVRPEDIMTIEVKAKDNQGIKEILADMGGVETIKLSLVEGTEKEGEWLAEWKVHDTESKWYETIVTVLSFSGAIAITTIKWKDPTTYTWDGSDSTDWFTGANWDQTTVPGDTDDVVINGGYTYAPTINAADTIGSLAIGQNNASVLTFSNNITLTVGGNVTVYANGTITHTANTTAETHKLTITASGSMTIDNGGKIDASAKGYNAQTGPGYSSQYCSSYGPGSGASYGGWGGCNTTVGTYGSITAPTNIGSGGRNGYAGGAGTKGGGAIKLDVTGTLTISGTISAEGQDSTGGGNCGGAGSGGSIWIIAGFLSGSAGSIVANGGDTAGSCGGGGGGRIAITGYSSDNFTGTKSAYGGSSAPDGGAGTIYTKSSSQANGDVLVDNYNLGGPDLNTLTASSYTFDGLTVQNTGKAKTGTSTTLSLTTLTAQTSSVFTSQYTSTATTLTGDATGSVVTASGGSLTISNTTLSNPPVTNNGTFTANGASFILQTTFVQNGTVNFPSSDLTVGSGGTLEIKNTNLTLNNLTIQSGGTLTHTANTTTETYKIVLTINQDMNINSSGKVDVDQKGYNLGNGPGYSAQLCFVGGPGSGASYGGWGGCNTTNGPYGSESAPINIGSGGKNAYLGNPGGKGGGAVRIDVTGTLTISGEITADGQGTTGDGGGGSGGSVYLNVGTLDGCGTISATGGNSPSGGGGGGGRIAYYYTTDNFSSCGTVTAAGGTGGTASGGSGSVIPENLWFFIILAPFLPKILRKRLKLARI